nr:unnamed protein product [Callosobruchus analis]
MAKRITSREERQVLYGKSFSYNHIVNSKAIPGSHLKTKHSSVSSKKLKSCVLCDATFKRKTSLDDHVVKNHPNDIASLSNKVYECSECLYKTVAKNNYLRHVSVNHTEADLREKHTCPHCNVALRRKSSLNDHILGKHPDFIGSITKKIYECTECAWKTTSNSRYLKHTSAHHERGSSDKLVNCIHCNAAFKKKTQLDEHLLKKHPDSITSIARKVYECTECVFRTTVKSKFRTHTSTHGKTGPSCKSTKRINCIHCDSTFRKRSTLEEHILKRHPDFIPTITRQIYECVQCIYKTTFKNELVSHMLKHSDSKNICIHCNATFKSKTSLDDHVVKKHPDFSSSITSKLHECTKCTFKTVKKDCFDKHSLKHLGLNSICVHCNATFKSKTSLDDHVIRKHPDFISSIVSKLHECTKCTFKTTVKSSFNKHVKHVHDNKKCVHCNATFKSKTSLDDHVIRKHPDFISSIVSKLHECTKCTFKTTSKCSFDKHLLKHPGLASVCINCNTTFKSKKSLDHHVLRKHPDFFTTVTSKLYECTDCTFKTVIKSDFDKHLLKHSDFKYSACVHCNATFKSKKSLDDHVLRKHPDFFTAVTYKVHECIKCSFKTIIKRCFDRHLLNHPELLCICTHCNATFKGKVSLDDHVVKKHPDFISSITSKLHECTKCTFKTTSKEHLLNHPEIASNFKPKICIHCNATFKGKMSLDDHVVRKHPDFSTTVTSKLHKCTKCAFKTVKKGFFDKHLLKHLGKHITCVHCNATFTSKMSLDDHVVRKHPDFISSVTSKLYECTKCTFKTVKKICFSRHLLKHPGHVSDFNHITCVHCNATFESKMSLDGHVVRKHPDFISSVTSKLYECTKCTFKTVQKSCFSRHLLKHPGLASDFKHITCVHCNATFKSKMSLDDHVVRKHPDFISSVTSKLYECTKCTFKTVKKSFFSRHLLKHSGLVSDFKLITCVHCNATFKSKMALDGHVVRKHPDFISSITSKLYECTKCTTFKTVKKSCFSRHLLKHPGLASDFKHITCVHCNATFKSKIVLDHHVLRKHPDFISSVTSKLHECTECAYKTVIKSYFDKHLLKHSDFAQHMRG